jgi:hypothetical protein
MRISSMLEEQKENEQSIGVESSGGVKAMIVSLPSSRSNLGSLVCRADCQSRSFWSGKIPNLQLINR